MLLEVNNIEELRASVANHETTVVVLTQPRTCVPCRQFKPHLEKTAEQLEDFVFVVADLDKVPEAMTEYNVMSVPTVKRFRDGNYEGDLKARTVVALLNELK